jgi:hypothetical protein
MELSFQFLEILPFVFLISIGYFHKAAIFMNGFEIIPVVVGYILYALT